MEHAGIVGVRKQFYALVDMLVKGGTWSLEFWQIKKWITFIEVQIYKHTHSPNGETKMIWCEMKKDMGLADLYNEMENNIARHSFVVSLLK